MIFVAVFLDDRADGQRLYPTRTPAAFRARKVQDAPRIKNEQPEWQKVGDF